MILIFSALEYEISGTEERGYVVLESSVSFIVPAGARRLDVIVIGGGGGGSDPCARNTSLHNAGHGGMSQFGQLRAYGGQGGTPRKGICVC